MGLFMSLLSNLDKSGMAGLAGALGECSCTLPSFLPFKGTRFITERKSTAQPRFQPGSS